MRFPPLSFPTTRVATGYKSVLLRYSKSKKLNFSRDSALLSFFSYSYIGRHVIIARFKALVKIVNFKGPFKYLVAKLRLLPRCKFTSGQPKFFARSFRRRPVADSSRCLTFLLRCNKHKKHILITFLLINVLLYGYNM